MEDQNSIVIDESEVQDTHHCDKEDSPYSQPCDNMMEVSDYTSQLSDLPEEILERVLCFLSPYNDYDTAKLVCHQWHRVINSLIRQSRRSFFHRIGSNKVDWTEVLQAQRVQNSVSPKTSLRLLSISERFSHSCAYLNGSMYVFGGCTNTNTTFNDLWRLDLTTRRWMRPVASGSYPSPKACASMVVNEGKLVLFGGWSQPIPYPLHQSANYFSELHTYDPATNRWSQLLSVGPEPDALGGHSASIIQGLMVIFGGSPRSGQGSNKLWVYDFRKSCWHSPKVKAGVCPEPRYGQYQCTLDDNHILIMGGCGGPYKVYDDFYILTMELGDCWYWTKLQVQHPEFAPRLVWCHAVCRVDNKLVVLCKSQKQRESLNVKPSTHCVEDPAKQQIISSEKKHLLAAAATPDSNASQKPFPLEPSKPEPVPLSNSEVVSQAADNNESHPVSSPNNRNLLALQQRLHREYVNLTDQDNHQHNSHLDNNIPEGQIHRLQNRSNQNEGSNHHHHHHHHQPHQQHNHHYQLVQEANQPHAGQLRRIGHQAMGAPGVRESPPMPSIRPNANSNRQKQLEALQRQEELLRSKSKALAEARKKSLSESSSRGASDYSMDEDDEEELPRTVLVKNRLDVHIVDITTALTTGQVEWKPESPLMPPGAPMETMCCSLVEGRAELILFGGLLRDPKIPVVQNTALNRLYILHT